jgi:prevent-host-death family protein
MTRTSIVNLRRNLSDALNRVAYGGERVVLERRGKGVAALVSLDDLAALEAAEDRRDIELAHAARAEGGRPVPLEELARRLKVALPHRRRRVKLRGR